MDTNMAQINAVSIGLLAAALVLNACGGGTGLDGRYEGDWFALEIKGGTATLLSDGEPVREMPIKRDGDRLKVEAPDGVNIFTIGKDGSLSGSGQTLVRCTNRQSAAGRYAAAQGGQTWQFEFRKDGSGTMNKNERSQEFNWTETAASVSITNPDIGIKKTCDGRLPIRNNGERVVLKPAD